MNDLYDLKYFNATKRFQKNEARLNGLVNSIIAYAPLSYTNTVLDVGCGFGLLVQKLRKQGMEAIGVDFAPVLKEKFWGNNPNLTISDANELPFPDKSFDVVVSSDFFEHIPEDQIDKVYSEMKRVCNGVVMARIAYQSKLRYRQTLYHVTNKPKEWWAKKLPGCILI